MLYLSERRVADDNLRVGRYLTTKSPHTDRRPNYRSLYCTNQRPPKKNITWPRIQNSRPAKMLKKSRAGLPEIGCNDEYIS